MKVIKTYVDDEYRVEDDNGETLGYVRKHTGLSFSAYDDEGNFIARLGTKERAVNRVVENAS